VPVAFAFGVGGGRTLSHLQTSPTNPKKICKKIFTLGQTLSEVVIIITQHTTTLIK